MLGALFAVSVPQPLFIALLAVAGAAGAMLYFRVDEKKEALLDDMIESYAAMKADGFEQTASLNKAVIKGDWDTFAKEMWAGARDLRDPEKRELIVRRVGKKYLQRIADDPAKVNEVLREMGLPEVQPEQVVATETKKVVASVAAPVVRSVAPLPSVSGT